MKLDHNDITSQLWIKLKAHWEKELETLRFQLEGDKPDLMTAKLRGRIAEIKTNLSLAHDKPVLDNEVFTAPE